MDEMYVVKRDGQSEIVSFDKILQRIKKAGQDAQINLNYTALTMKVIDQLYDGISTTKIDELTADQCASLASTHPDYNVLAGRIIVSNHHKNTSAVFTEVMQKLYEYKDKHGKHSPLLDPEVYRVIQENAAELDAMCDYNRDYLIDFFGFKTLDRAYMMKVDRQTVERPQHMWLRVAVGIHYKEIGVEGLTRIRRTYDAMSLKYMTHATPTLFNAGTPHPQLSSCFLLQLETDSIEGIYNTLKDCAVISKWAGGIGLHIHNVRAKGSHIRGTNGSSNGIVPMLRVFNNTAKYVDQCLSPDTILYTRDGLIPISQAAAKKTRIFNIGVEEDQDQDQDEDYSGQKLDRNSHDDSDEDEKSLDNTYPRYNFRASLWEFFVSLMDALSRVLLPQQYHDEFDESTVNLDNDALDSDTEPDDEDEDEDEDPITDEAVHQVLEHAYEGPIIHIRTHLPTDTLKITPEHPVLAISSVSTDHSTLRKDLELGLTILEWIDAKELKKGYWITYPIPSYEDDIASLTTEDCLMYGLMMCGLNHYMKSESVQNQMYKDRTQKDPKYMHLFLNGDDHNQLINLFQREQIQYDTMDEYPGVIRLQPSPNNPFTKSDFYNSRGELEIASRLMFLPENKLLSIIQGLGGYQLFSMRIRSPLIESAMFICLKARCLEKCVHPFLRDTIILDDDMYLVPIASVMETEYNGIVYDLQLEQNHNYLTNGGLVHNGGGKRNGSFAIYLEPWHADIEAFLQMRKNHGDEELKARDLFYALWIPDLFMERVKVDGSWTLMCPDECPGLADVYGQDFVDLYTRYEAEGRGRATVKARQLWFQVLDAQMETGTPYLLYKDACNKKSNQKNLGTIKSSNLCSEVVQHSDENESAVCNLASIGLPAFVKPSTPSIAKPTFDFDKLHEIVQLATYNLNCVIDVNYYPTEKTRRSNMRHRPIGLGVQGLADTFILMGYPFDSEEARQLNRDIFETMYHAALTQSCELAQRYGPYETFEGSPASQGLLQFDLWNTDRATLGNRYDWFALKTQIQENGLRNSLLLAPMPTASTSQILGYNECIEPITSNIYSRRTLAGEFIMANRYLMKDLIDLGLWNEKIKNNIIANHGSVQQIDVIPADIKAKYRTVWEIPMRSLIDMAADRGIYVCQSQSLNLWLEDPTYSTLTSMHFYSWSKGLKTGIYYLRRRGRHQAQQFTIEPELAEKNKMAEAEDEICEMCSA
jgi:ribonucleoside-diphosphate reductase alpha subunit